MSQLIIRAGDFTFGARFEEEAAPKTCAAFKKAMPFVSKVIHVRWSGEMGQLAGNHFITLTSGLENLTTLGKSVLWKGAQDIRFEMA
jgi:hypothetical protein